MLEVILLSLHVVCMSVPRSKDKVLVMVIMFLHLAMSCLELMQCQGVHSNGFTEDQGGFTGAKG